jgi:hypothetical protein
MERVMLKGLRVLACAVLMIVLGCGGGGQAIAARPPLPIHQDLGSLVKATPLIIVGKVVEIRPGRVAASGEGRLQFNDVHIVVEKRLKGKPSNEIVVEQVDMSRAVFVSEVGPPYKRDERYLLLLERGEGDRYITVIQGRYLLRGGVVEPLDPGPAADRLKGMAEAKVIEEIDAMARKGQ